jgi:hypothetical protein
LNNREAYHKLFDTVKQQDKRIEERYDGLSGSDYVFAEALILFDGQITEEEMNGFSEDTKEIIRRWLLFLNRNT